MVIIYILQMSLAEVCLGLFSSRNQSEICSGLWYGWFRFVFLFQVDFQGVAGGIYIFRSFLQGEKVFGGMDLISLSFRRLQRENIEEVQGQVVLVLVVVCWVCLFKLGFLFLLRSFLFLCGVDGLVQVEKGVIVSQDLLFQVVVVDSGYD